MKNDDVFILIPGILGSVLQKDGKDVLGLSASAGFRALFTLGDSIQSLHLEEPSFTPENPTPDLDDGVSASRLEPDIHMIPGLWKIDGYTKVKKYLLTHFKLVEGQNYFEFPYDWRRDNRVAAYQLAKMARELLVKRRAQYPNAKLVLIAHSMGGLVSRYFLEVLGGWKDTRHLITFGTPYRGSLNALDFVANGFSKYFGLVDLTDLLCSFTSVHQLLPIYKCIKIGENELLRLTKISDEVHDEIPYEVLERMLSRLKPDKITAARLFHTEIENAVNHNLQDEEYKKNRYKLGRVVGISQPTYQSAEWNGNELEMLCTYDGQDYGGDGTVPRVSASPFEYKNDDDAMFSNDKHGSLQNNDGVFTQVSGWLNGIDLGPFKAMAPIGIAVDTADVHKTGEPIHVHLKPSLATTGLEVTLEWVSGPAAQNKEGTILAKTTKEILEGDTDIELPAQQPGVYRLNVKGENVESVTDFIVVAPA